MSKGFCSLVYGMVLFVIASTVIGPCLAQEETVDSGLIAHWKFEEGAGDVIKNSSGEGNDGTIVPANTPEPKWGTGDFANSVSFSGGNDHFIRIPPSASLNNLKKQISVVALIYPRTLWTPGSPAPSRMEESSQSGQKTARHGSGPLTNRVHRDCSRSMERNNASRSILSRLRAGKQRSSLQVAPRLARRR